MTATSPYPGRPASDLRTFLAPDGRRFLIREVTLLRGFGSVGDRCAARLEWRLEWAYNEIAEAHARVGRVYGAAA
jgi:hypothetical protein